MNELIERLEKATGPDGHLDCQIRAAVEGWKNVGGGFREWPDGRRERYDYGNAEPYTGSLDAALTLVPDTLFWIMGKGRVRSGEPLYAFRLLRPSDTHKPVAEAEHDSLPISIVLAALHARSTSQ